MQKIFQLKFNKCAKRLTFVNPPRFLKSVITTIRTRTHLNFQWSIQNSMWPSHWSRMSSGQLRSWPRVRSWWTTTPPSTPRARPGPLHHLGGPRQRRQRLLRLRSLLRLRFRLHLPSRQRTSRPSRGQYRRSCSGSVTPPGFSTTSPGRRHRSRGWSPATRPTTPVLPVVRLPP